MTTRNTRHGLTLATVLCGGLALLVGCQGESNAPAASGNGPLIDIKTPIGDVKVGKDPETGRAQVDVDARGVKVDVGSNE